MRKEEGGEEEERDERVDLPGWAEVELLEDLVSETGSSSGGKEGHD